MSDFHWALEKLKIFNDLVLKDKELNHIFTQSEYNFLQAYQVPIFFDLVLYFNSSIKNVSNSKRENNKESFWHVRARQFFAIIYSLFSYVFLVISRRDLLVYTADKDTNKDYKCDFRTANLFKILYNKKIKFFEIIHTVFKSSFINLALKRHRPSIYLESIDVLYKIFSQLGIWSNSENKKRVDLLNSKNINNIDINIFRPIILKYIHSIDRSLFRIAFFENILRFTNVKTLIATADTRNNTELVCACNNLGIKTYGFQGGNISKYNVGYIYSGGGGKIIKPNFMIVESEYWKKELMRLGTYFEDEEIVVGGNLKEDYKFINGVNEIKSNTLSILIPYEIATPKEEILVYIKRILECPNTKIIFKMRADRDMNSQILEYGMKGLSKNIEFVKDLKDVKSFDLVGGTYSTFLYEMIGYNKPVILFKSSLDYGEGMLINNIADEINIEDDAFCEKLNKIKNISKDIISSRRNKLYNKVVPLESTIEDIIDSKI